MHLKIKYWCWWIRIIRINEINERIIRNYYKVIKLTKRFIKTTRIQRIWFIKSSINLEKKILMWNIKHGKGFNIKRFWNRSSKITNN